jgi:geranylgeranyl diphosphate synthase type II
MVGGQAVDLVSEGNAALNGHRAQVLDYIHRHKTGALIQASLDAGAVLAGATAAQRKALQRYGEHIGLAFKLPTMCWTSWATNTFWARPGRIKKTETDFPVGLRLEDSRRRAQQAVTEAKRALRPFGKKADILSALADYMIERDRDR